MIDMEKLPVVVSYYRSGTHWLCSLICQWFYWGRLKEQEHIESVLKFQDWESGDVKSYPWAHLLGGHIYSNSSPMAKALHPRKIIYLFRSGRDSLPSYWRLRKAEAEIEGYPTCTFPEFLKLSPEIVEGNPYPAGMNIRDILLWSQWRWMDSLALHIRYEDMVQDIGSVRDRLSFFLGLEAAPLHFPADRRVGYMVPQGSMSNDELWDSVE